MQGRRFAEPRPRRVSDCIYLLTFRSARPWRDFLASETLAHLSLDDALFAREAERHLGRQATHG